MNVPGSVIPKSQNHEKNLNIPQLKDEKPKCSTAGDTERRDKPRHKGQISQCKGLEDRLRTDF
jgi:hypothetical protein